MPSRWQLLTSHEELRTTYHELSPMSYLFGPVASRRLGLSLGVDLIPPKTCPLDCIYCEVGRTTVKTLARQEYIPAAAIIAELTAYFAGCQEKPDYVTLAGSGEPTLNRGLGRIIAHLKQITAVPVAVLTNGVLLTDPQVRRELCQADVILPSLDAVTPALFAKINRPLAGVTVETLIAGLKALRREFAGRIWLEILLLQGLNDTPTELARLKTVVQDIQPDEIHLNTAVRPVVEHYARALSPEALAAAAAFLGPQARVIASRAHPHQSHFDLSDADFLASLARRPQTAADLAAVLHLPEGEVAKRLHFLAQQGRVRATQHENQVFYQTVAG
ncbi:MAG: radical SAM protein [Desulfobacca sp.]|uniref:radical SAM protein n=1 Tax=Desulfobacca sp. TaxID=2067990 RepID=UPI004049A655